MPRSFFFLSLRPSFLIQLAVSQQSTCMMMTGGRGFDAHKHVSIFFRQVKQKKTLNEGKRESLANRHDQFDRASAIRTVRNPHQQG
jgi:hypothetical protein